MWRSSHDVIEKLDANIGCDCFSLGDILVEEANGIERVCPNKSFLLTVSLY